MDAKFKTLRHIEAVRNYINLCVRELLSCLHYSKGSIQMPEISKNVIILTKDEYNSALNDAFQRGVARGKHEVNTLAGKNGETWDNYCLRTKESV